MNKEEKEFNRKKYKQDFKNKFPSIDLLLKLK